MKKRLLAILALGGSTSLFGQEMISATGAYLKTENVSIQYSMGEISSFTATGESQTLTQGFVQPQISVEPSSSVSDMGTAYGIALYPNPTQGNVTLQFDKVPDGASYTLFSASGALVASEKIAGQNSAIPLGNCPAGVYHIVLQSEKCETANYKIIKKQ